LSNIQAEDFVPAGLDFVEPQSGCLGKALLPAEDFVLAEGIDFVERPGGLLWSRSMNMEKS
jgi:hypothetical protein